MYAYELLDLAHAKRSGRVGNNYFQLDLDEASLIMMPRTIYFSNMKIYYW